MGRIPFRLLLPHCNQEIPVGRVDARIKHGLSLVADNNDRLREEGKQPRPHLAIAHRWPFMPVVLGLCIIHHEAQHHPIRRQSIDNRVQ